MIEANKYKLGIFVITGIALLIAVLFMLGLSEALKPKINFITYFKESVQGLDIGSPVKFRGVTIGKVTRIAIRSKDNFIRVDMQARPSSIQPSKPGAEPVDFFKNLKSEVKRGLRCRLELKGITGMKYIEMDYLSEDKRKKKNTDPFMCTTNSPECFHIAPPKDTLYIPSSPSLLAGLRTSLSVALARISSIDFKKMSNDISETLNEAKKVLSNKNIAEVIKKMDTTFANISTLTENLNASLSKSKVDALTDEISKALKNIRKLSENADSQLQKAQIAETTEAIRELKMELSTTAEKLNHTLDAVTELAGSIDNDPGSLVRGRKNTTHIKN